METKHTPRRGIGAISLLGIIFTLCKIFEIGEVANWSWWVVLLPFYVPLIIAMLVLFIAVVITVTESK